MVRLIRIFSSVKLFVGVGEECKGGYMVILLREDREDVRFVVDNWWVCCWVGWVIVLVFVVL